MLDPHFLSFNYFCILFCYPSSEITLARKNIMKLEVKVVVAVVWYIYRMSDIKDAIIDGVGLFDKVHGMTGWKYVEKDAKLNHTFNKAMEGISAIIMRKYLEVYDGFEGISTLADVGGGTGQSLKMIISKHPHIKGINFDLPHVIQHAPPYPGIY